MNPLVSLFKETYCGKTIARTLFNWEISKHVKNIGGVVIDLGGGKNPSYERFWHVRPEKFIRVDINKKTEPDIVADLNKPLPFSDNFADTVFLFNVIYILESPNATLKEIYRILKPGGKLFLTSPFIFNEAKEPADYWRLTSEALEKLLEESGFNNFFIEPIGERFSAAVYLISPFLFFWPVKFAFYCLALLFDKLILKKLKLKQPSPIGYFVETAKS
ncbi:MAG: methyltransferase domain-containing protein [Candidatus Azambacteria bacterium]|nr:methyltransferase domain-containing protein [Candidatus Azambacteria bacterium]